VESRTQHSTGRVVRRQSAGQSKPCPLLPSPNPVELPPPPWRGAAGRALPAQERRGPVAPPRRRSPGVPCAFVGRCGGTHTQTRLFKEARVRFCFARRVCGTSHKRRSLTKLLPARPGTVVANITTFFDRFFGWRRAPVAEWLLPWLPVPRGRALWVCAGLRRGYVHAHAHGPERVETTE
jgi:hypothetical protein